MSATTLPAVRDAAGNEVTTFHVEWHVDLGGQRVQMMLVAYWPPESLDEMRERALRESMVNLGVEFVPELTSDVKARLEMERARA